MESSSPFPSLILFGLHPDSSCQQSQSLTSQVVTSRSPDEYNTSRTVPAGSVPLPRPGCRAATQRRQQVQPGCCLVGAHMHAHTYTRTNVANLWHTTSAFPNANMANESQIRRNANRTSTSTASKSPPPPRSCFLVCELQAETDLMCTRCGHYCSK